MSSIVHDEQQLLERILIELTAIGKVLAWMKADVLAERARINVEQEQAGQEDRDLAKQAWQEHMAIYHGGTRRIGTA